MDDPSQPGGAILASEDVKAIFGSLPEMEIVHRSMRDDLEDILKSWNEKSCVGDLILKYVSCQFLTSDNSHIFFVSYAEPCDSEQQQNAKKYIFRCDMCFWLKNA